MVEETVPPVEEEDDPIEAGVDDGTDHSPDPYDEDEYPAH